MLPGPRIPCSRVSWWAGTGDGWAGPDLGDRRCPARSVSPGCHRAVWVGAPVLDRKGGMTHVPERRSSADRTARVPEWRRSSAGDAAKGLSLAFEFAGAVFLFWFLGRLVDNWLDIEPWAQVAGSLIGWAGGFAHVYYSTQRGRDNGSSQNQPARNQTPQNNQPAAERDGGATT
jgi:F0F1-type ATP synthase assembly protein I